MLMSLGGHRNFIRSRDFSDDELADILGLGKWLDTDEQEFDATEVKKILTDQLRLASKSPAPPLPPILKANIERLAIRVGMNQVECHILAFAAMLHHEDTLDKGADTLSVIATSDIASVLAKILDLPTSDVRTALANQGVLARSGLLSVDRSGAAPLRSKLDLLSNQFADAILGTETDPLNLLRDTVAPSPPARLTLDDFSHIHEALTLLRPYLTRVIQEGRTGVNIFIYGPPGTGKSELARTLAAELHCELLEIASEDDDGDAVTGERRLRAYRAAQCFFDQRHALLVFDEVEDIFSNGIIQFGNRSTAVRCKAWLNRTLENNRVPTIWISNSIQGIDPAFMRRFDLQIELPIPPRQQRERILHSVCSDLADTRTLAMMAGVENLAPAVVERAANVVRTIRTDIADGHLAEALMWLTNRSLEAQGHRGIDLSDAPSAPEQYDTGLLNTDVDLETIKASLMKHASARICLYGPPGTGKSGFGRWLALQLDKPLVLRSVSELSSKWVGDSEKAIAAAFRQAEREKAILMLDEVDSFLRNRAGAREVWEVTQVNEMLTRMESFEGIFIASTNLMDSLDPAALRRFDLKIELGYLRPEQATQLLLRTCHALNLGDPTQHDCLQLGSIGCLTPGDFASVTRRHRVSPFSSNSALISALRMECALKPNRPHSMGFLS
ncbi:AAA family ATPase [Pseudoduganella sp. FT93W]|uniref:AAA family ATPase n=2 Tax=Duganella fentianensis TaxID=2692177 RepID=A0A845HYF1_9BURK|nr:AAA family ATPase [Duganella fentianensis]